ncbi:MAG: recombinase family protein [Isosphaeraceae bacterium]
MSPIAKRSDGKDDKVVALFLRRSRASQKTPGQEADLKAYAGAGASAGGYRWYRCAWTGSEAKRPVWDKLMADIAAGKVSTVVCWRFDRLGQTCSELVKFFAFLNEHQVNLISLQDEFNLATAEGSRTVETLASVARFESEVRSQRILAGQAVARARGVRWGGSVMGRRLKVTRELESRVRRLRKHGMNITEIGRETGLSRPTIYRVLDEHRPYRDK